MPRHASVIEFRDPNRPGLRNPNRAARPSGGAPRSSGGAARRAGLRRPGRVARAAAGAALAFLLCACAAASRPADPARPRAAEAPYPVVLGASEERREKALAAWAALSVGEAAGNNPAPDLRPVTATLKSLPAASPTALRLPLVGGAGDKPPTEEEERESLRRFITSASPLLGADIAELSLVEDADNGGGAKRAIYQQKAFDYPLRGGYGVVEIVHAPDRRVLALSSTAIPDTERLRRALASARQQLPPDVAPPSIANRAVTFNDAAGVAQTYTVTATDEVRARELVVYPLPSAGDPATLELHLAWEMTVERAGAPLLVYLDAVNGEVIAAAPAPPSKG